MRACNTRGALLNLCTWRGARQQGSQHTGAAVPPTEDGTAERPWLARLFPDARGDEKRLLGNFPQAFSHVGLVNTAFNLTEHLTSPAVHRQSCNEER